MAPLLLLYHADTNKKKEWPHFFSWTLCFGEPISHYVFGSRPLIMFLEPTSHYVFGSRPLIVFLEPDSHYILGPDSHYVFGSRTLTMFSGADLSLCFFSRPLVWAGLSSHSFFQLVSALVGDISFTQFTCTKSISFSLLVQSHSHLAYLYKVILDLIDSLRDSGMGIHHKWTRA